MADVDSLFRDYVAEHKAGGEADPRRYLRQLEGTNRAELAALIDGYLVRSPGQRWDPEKFSGSAAEQWAEAMARSLAGSAGTWPVLLPRLRERAKIRRAELVERLAAALGVGGQEEKVASYYHQMEQGQLPSKGVSSKVLEALAAIVGSSAEALRSAGEQVGEGGAPPAETVFARTAMPRPEYSERMASPGAEPPAPAPQRASEPGQPDEVDRLFAGGD